MGKYLSFGKQIVHVTGEDEKPLTTHIADCGDSEKAHFLAAMANAPKAEDGGPIQPFDYVGQAVVTLSPSFHGGMVTLQHFDNVLRSTIANLQELDKIKKSLFYGKDNYIGPEAGLNVLSDCSDLPTYIVGLDRVDAINFIHGAIGLATESGELLELLRDTLDAKPLDKTNLKEEVGDGKWYMAILATVGGFIWGDDERTNIAKLRARFPDRFTEYDANNRDLTAERAILEGDAVNQLSLGIDVAPDNVGKSDA